MIGSESAIGSWTMGLVNPGAGIITLSSTALLTSIAILITNENISKFKKYTKLRDWINVITLQNENMLECSMVDKKIDGKEALKLGKINNHYLVKRKEIMKNTQFKVEDVFGDVISNAIFSQDQVTKLKIFSDKIKRK